MSAGHSAHSHSAHSHSAQGAPRGAALGDSDTHARAPRNARRTPSVPSPPRSFWNASVTALLVALALAFPWDTPTFSLGTLAHAQARPRVAGITTVYYHNSHADLLLSRFLQGYSLDGTGDFPRLELAALHIDQFPANDTGRPLAARHHVPLYPTVAAAVTRGGNQLDVDAVLLIAEHGDYPESDTGQFQFPKRAMFAEIARVCERSGRSVPVFLDKHLADNWTDARWIYDEARRLRLPLMAGSSLPVLWRHPPVDTRRDAPLREVLALSYHRLDSYGIHALEIIQSLAERRHGGETGIRQVRTYSGDEAWRAIERGEVDPRLLEQCLATHKNRPIPRDKPLARLVPDPTLMRIDYRDGLRASVLSLGQLYIDFTAAWRYADGTSESAVFWTQEARPFTHLGLLLREVEPFLRGGPPAWPVERTLLTTGALDALLVSRRDGGRVVDTPHLALSYQSSWNWRQPPPPDPDRPLNAQ